LGKKEYAPEEQIRKGQAFVNSDLYSLAVTALVLLTGKDPLELYDSYKATWRWGKAIKVSRQLESIFKKMLAHKPSDRFASADEVLHALQSKTRLTNSNTSQTHTAATANLIPSSSTSKANVSQVHTLVIAPGKPAPIAIAKSGGQAQIAPVNPAPSPIAATPDHPAIQKPPQFLNWLGLWLLKVGVGTGLALVTGFAGWAVMSSMIRSTPLGPLVKQSPTTKPIKSLNSSEQKRVEKLVSRRQALGIDEATFNVEVNKRFYEKHPQLNGRPLTTKTEDAAFREEWYKIADDFLASTPRR
jgi:serine/threonine-protein kinase